MGTRGLTAVYYNGRHHVAQYGQWDHYPSGQGITALNFLRGEGNVDSLLRNLSHVRFIDSDEHERRTQHITQGRQFITMEESAQIDQVFPYLSRDHGAEILSLIAKNEVIGGIELFDQIEFAKDSLFCEYAYVVDLDTRQFEVYEGFQQSPHNEGRFATDKPNDAGYYPVRLVKSWSLDELPTEEEFYATFGEDE